MKHYEVSSVGPWAVSAADRSPHAGPPDPQLVAQAQCNPIAHVQGGICKSACGRFFFFGGGGNPFSWGIAGLRRSLPFPCSILGGLSDA